MHRVSGLCLLMAWLAACAPASEPSPEPATAQPERGARLQPGTQLGIYLPETARPLRRAVHHYLPTRLSGRHAV